MFVALLLLTISYSWMVYISLTGHPLSTYAKFSEKLTYLTPWYEHVRGLFVRIKSMQLGFSGFSKHVSCLMRLFRQYELQNVLMVSSSMQTLKFPRSMIFLISSRCLIILFLCGLYEQLKRYFLLRWLISAKRLSANGKSWQSTLAGIYSRMYSMIPPPYLLWSNLKGAW